MSATETVRSSSDALRTDESPAPFFDVREDLVTGRVTERPGGYGAGDVVLDGKTDETDDWTVDRGESRFVGTAVSTPH